MALGGEVRSVTVEGARRRPAAEGGALHDRLVAYTDAVSGALLREQRTGVWSEHSYARARCGPPSASVRVLLAPPTPPAAAPGDPLDVTGAPREPPPLPHDGAEGEPDPADCMESDDDWEERVAAHPPSEAHGRLARTALRALGDARLARLAGRGGRAARRDEARAAAARLRAALAPLWARGGPPALRPPAWLHAQLSAHLPASYRPLYEDVLAELRRAVPRLAERLGAARLPPPADDPLAPDKGRAVRGAQAAGPWLAWLRCGCGRGEERWERRLSAALYTRVLPAAGGAAPPDRWAAAALHAAKLALADVVEDAGGRPVIVGGCGAGAGMAAALAAGAGEGGVRGALLVAPAPLTAEGPRALPDDALHEVAVPVLAVCGGRGAAELAGGGRRVLAVAGADAALRLPLRARRRLRLPQHALDAALAEEMVRWCVQVAEARAAPDGDEYSHLPPLAPLAPLAPAAPHPSATPSGTGRAVEFAEGRVVARVSASTPLLLTPRRPPAASQPAPAAPPAQLAVADIMQLPIVFADDEPPALAPLAPLNYPEGGGGGGGAGRPVTVTSGGARPPPARTRAAPSLAQEYKGAAGAAAAAGAGGVRYTRVIVAKRRGRLPRP